MMDNESHLADREKIISQKMNSHYSQKFMEFGATSKGVDWGREEDLDLRYYKMLAVIDRDMFNSEKTIKLLDVGCGYGGLFKYAQQQGLSLQYTGIDVASNMISWAKENWHTAEFVEGDFMHYSFGQKKFDYVVCNGILTQKLEVSLLDMDVFAKRLIRKMFDVCDHGVAFNIMSTYVNFFAPNLYYKHPSDLLAYCLSEISRKIKLDHSYGLYEYTTYLYK
jgi:SAM-dependent methyltransferase